MSASEDEDYESAFPIRKKVKTEGEEKVEDEVNGTAKLEEEKKDEGSQINEEKDAEEEEGEVAGKNPLWDVMEEENKAKEKEVQIEELPNTQFYDKKGNLEYFERRTLETIRLRNYHNWIKSVLINKYVNELKNYYRSHYRGFYKICVLDLGCGNGGDLTKWAPNNISYYVGVDISKTAVENAYQRWKTMPVRQHQNKFLADFISVGGGASEPSFFKNINDNVYFDLVSSQFVIHYMFSRERYVENLFNNISKRLLKNGYFICTIPDADVMVKRIRAKGVKNENGEVVLGNQFYSIKFRSDKFPRGHPYGLEYGFFLDDSAVGKKEIQPDGTVKITYVPEYLIIPENFVKVAKRYDLELVEEKNFHDFCKESIKNPNFVRLMQTLKIDDIGEMPHELWEISYLYKVAVFKKTSGLEMNENDRNFNNFSQGRVVLQEPEEEDEGSPEVGVRHGSQHGREEDQLSEGLFGDDDDS